MLVAVKTHSDEHGNLKWPSWVNRGLDVDVIVSEVRETSRKPDEVYGMIERMCPGGRKIGDLQHSWRLSALTEEQRYLAGNTILGRGMVPLVLPFHMLTCVDGLH